MTMTAAGVGAPSAIGTAVQLAGVTKRFGDTEVLTDVYLDVQPGEFNVLLGPSGSGKSTLIRCLAGVEQVTSGTVTVGGQVVDDGRRPVPPEKRDLAMVFQDYALWPHMTVRDNVAYALRRQRLDAVAVERRTMEALELVGLPQLGHRYPGQLSGGQQQRVALARAIIARPGLLLFDEPLSNLDADLRERLRVEIARVTRRFGATAVYITHDQSEAFALADRVGVLEAGRLVQFATPETVYHRPATPFIARFTGIAVEWRGTIIYNEGAYASVLVGNVELRARSMGSMPVGAPCSVLVRPAATSIVASDGRSGIEGVVSDVAFRGRGYDHVITTTLGDITGVHATHAQERDARVRVAIDADGCLAYPRNR